MLRAPVVLAVAATTIGTVHAMKLGLPYSLGGSDAPLSEALMRSLGIWWLWALLTPLVFYVARSCHPERVGLRRAAVAHIAGAVLTSMAHSVVYVPVMVTLVWPEWLPELAGIWRRNVIGNVFGDVVTYAGLAAAWYAFDYRRAHRATALGLPRAEGAVNAEPAVASTGHHDAGKWLQRIPVRAAGRVMLIPVSDVEWIEASGDYAVLHSRDRQHLATERIATLATALDPSAFVRIHRSAIVRIDYIRELRARTHGDYDVVLTTGRTVRLSRTYRDAVAETLGINL